MLTYLFYTRNALMDRVYFDTSEYGINCWCACGHGACLSRMPRRPCRVPCLSGLPGEGTAIDSGVPRACRRWKDVDSPHVAKPAFIVHFAGCSMCSGFHADRLGECDAQFLKTYAEAFGRLSKEATQLHLL